MKIFSGKTCRFEKLKYFTVMISTLRTNYILQHFLVLSISRTNCIWQYFLVLSILRTNYILQYLLVTHYIGAQALFSASAAAKVVRKEFHFWPQKMSSSKSNAQRVLFSASKISSSKSNAQRVLLWEGAASKVIKTSGAFKGEVATRSRL